jgi:hypothetical protein
MEKMLWTCELSRSSSEAMGCKTTSESPLITNQTPLHALLLVPSGTECRCSPQHCKQQNSQYPGVMGVDAMLEAAYSSILAGQPDKHARLVGTRITLQDREHG